MAEGLNVGSGVPENSGCAPEGPGPVISMVQLVPNCTVSGPIGGKRRVANLVLIKFALQPAGRGTCWAVKRLFSIDVLPKSFSFP